MSDRRRRGMLCDMSTRTKPQITVSPDVEDIEIAFSVLTTGQLAQTAVMRLAQGEESGPLANEHPRSEQVLYVVRGEVEGEIGDEHVVVRQGESVIVPREVPHRFVNRKAEIAITFNVYTPPAY